MAVAQPAVPTDNNFGSVIPNFLGRGRPVAVYGAFLRRPLDVCDGLAFRRRLEVESRIGNNACGGESFSLATLFPTRELLDRKAERYCQCSMEYASVSFTEWGSILP